MKKLNDDDLETMVKDDFVPDEKAVRRQVNSALRLPHTNNQQDNKLNDKAVLDLHLHTEEQAWDKIFTLAKSGIRNATIITGASGILKIKFQQWATESILTPYIDSFKAINNGSFAVKFKKIQKI